MLPPSLVRRVPRFSASLPLASLSLVVCLIGMVRGQAEQPLSKVLTLNRAGRSSALPQDRGTPGLWQRILKLKTTASVLHITAHPDDEQGGVLAYLGRGLGVRTGLMTLTRGEAGANAIGSELFDSLGLIRTEELLLADRYYGLDDQYFGTVADYGYSKNVQEAMEKWGEMRVLEDLVRAIRINRPFVVISRFHGTERDGHGHHHAAGLMAQRAFQAAADLNVFPDQIHREGLRPWRALKLYRGTGFGRPEKWNLQVDPGRYSPWLGQSYQQFAMVGLSLQRSQNSGLRRDLPGSYPQFFERLGTELPLPDYEGSFFDGLDTSISGIHRWTANQPSEEVVRLLRSIEESVEQLVSAGPAVQTVSALPGLTRTLSLTRQALSALQEEPEAAFLLAIKERQIQDAIHTAAGVVVQALAGPAGQNGRRSPWAPPTTLGPATRAQQFGVRVTFSFDQDTPLEFETVGIQGRSGLEIQDVDGSGSSRPGVNSRDFLVRVSEGAPLDEPYFFRNSPFESHYQLSDRNHLPMPARSAALAAAVVYRVYGTRVSLTEPVQRMEPDLPYGYIPRQLKLVPEIAVRVEPEMRILPRGKRTAVKTVHLEVDVLNNREGGTQGTVRLRVPEGWAARPESWPFHFSEAGERTRLNFELEVGELEDRDYLVEVEAAAEGKAFTLGYEEIRHRDLDTNYLFRRATCTVRGVDFRIAPDLRVGYVMGVGDTVPSAIRQLGATVELLEEGDLRERDLSGFDAIVLGTRAYAVRKDLVTFNRRLLEYASGGGNLIVLYNTPEFQPDKWAPYPASLPQNAEEVSEEDAPVTLLEPGHSLLTWPNRITENDFEGWVEQRGSKFFSTWDPAYIALIESHDRDQEPQRGGWLTARYGKGHYTYFAYAFHRQAPYGVPGAFRIFANLLSLGKSAAR